ncbi:MAG: hypothetical protein GSR72_05145 [Desulfurococcales archaeon]|nr:hypothetical protein [Desulfurococcales archaeon]MEB3789258.1 hypothetical protein [Desulfurococcales archaeon]
MNNMKNDCHQIIIVNDTGAILAGLPLSLPAKHVTTEQVVSEVIDRESRQLLSTMIETQRLNVLSTDSNSLMKAKILTKKSRRLIKLSKTDLSVLALALSIRERCPESRVLVATDDYTLQEAVRIAGLEFITIRYKGIR